MRSTSSTRRATRAASAFRFAFASVLAFFALAIVGPHEFVDPGGVPVVQLAVADGGQLLAVLVRPQVGGTLEHQGVPRPEVEADDLAVAPGRGEPGVGVVAEFAGEPLVEF